MAALIPTSIFVMILLARPKTVIVDSDGIRQRHSFGVETRISWTDVGAIARGANTGTTYVRSKHRGLKIRFSPFLVGQSRFESEVRRHLHGRAVLEDL
jgi:hypothetical protein